MKKALDKQKIKIITISASTVVLLIGIIVTVACLNVESPPKKEYNEDDYDSVGAFAEKTDESSSAPTLSSTDPVAALEFESNGDGSCTVVGIGSFSGTRLAIPSENSNGETVTRIADRAFEGASRLELITIPPTVSFVGSGVFIGCRALCDITVSSSNTKYCSVGGVLFSKDRNELICYPSAKVGKSYLLSTNVRKISDFAFDGISNLKAIYYEGSASKYQSIEVGTGNQAFTALSVTCNYIPAK